VLCREERRSDSEPLRELDALRGEFPLVIADAGTSPVYRLQLTAMQALYDAEILRATGDPDCGKAWGLAADACARGDLPWEEAYALWRAAEAVVPDRGRRTEGGDLLRRAYRLAAELESVPLLHHLDGLARSARITINSPILSASATHDVGGGATTHTSEQSGSGHTITGLTPREREVLALVTTGRTYAEIARALYISEKTVSVHISNLLRKTGTANRIALARLAQRRTGT
jgi:DNA-binding CsgD family transcriptional regulator